MYVVMIFAAVFMGYSMGSAPLMSYQLGAKNTREMRCLLKKGLIFIGVSGIAMFALATSPLPNQSPRCLLDMTPILLI